MANEPLPLQTSVSLRAILSERLSVLRWGTVPDGQIVLDAAISAGSATLSSQTADFSGYSGKSVFIQGAGQGGADLLCTISRVNSPHSIDISTPAITTVSAAEARYGTDNTQRIQSAMDYAIQRGFALYFPRGKYLTTGTLTLRNNLKLHGDGWSYAGDIGAPSLIMCCANVPLFSGTDWLNGSIEKLALRGTRRSGSKGIFAVGSAGIHLNRVGFSTFGDHAIHLSSSIFGTHITECDAVHCHLDLSKASYVGVYDIDASDLFMSDCEVGAFPDKHNVSGYFGSGKIAAFAVRGGNSFIRECMGHHSQIGFYVGPSSGSLTTYTDCRADYNQGHGWVVDAFNCKFDGCRSHANVFDGSETYSAFLISGGGNQFNHCQVTTHYGEGTGQPIYGRYKHAFKTTTLGGYEANHFSANYTGPAAQFSDGAYYFEPTGQVLQCVDYKTNLEITGKRLHAHHGCIGIEGRDQGDGWQIIKTNDQDAGVDEKFWVWRPNYSPTYKQLKLVTYNDAFDSELPVIIIDRTGQTINLVEIYATLMRVVGDQLSAGRVLQLTGATPVVVGYTNTSAATDEKTWGLWAQKPGATSQFTGVLINDAGDSSAQWLIVSRTGMAIDQVLLRGTGIKLDGITELKNGARCIDGSGDPNGSVAGYVGDTFHRRDGGSATALYVKESGNGTNTGWVGK